MKYSLQDILKDIDIIFKSVWTTRAGRLVPDLSNIQLGNDAVTIEAAVLYADLAGSTDLVNNYKPAFAAEIYKAYLLAACRAIANNDGEVRAFDGDRVMAIFLGDSKNTNAVRTALQINFLVGQINQKIITSYANTSYKVNHKIGVDFSELFVAKTGARGMSDLVWVGRAANYAAKLSSIGSPDKPITITDSVFGKIPVTFGGHDKKNMFEKGIWNEYGTVVYQSNWTWKI